MSKSNSTNRLYVVARSPFELYFEGEALSVSACNRIGNFDILPGHADFFSMLTPSDVIIQPETAEKVVVAAKSGILTVQDNQAYLFLNM